MTEKTTFKSELTEDGSASPQEKKKARSFLKKPLVAGALKTAFLIGQFALAKSRKQRMFLTLLYTVVSQYDMTEIKSLFNKSKSPKDLLTTPEFKKFLNFVQAELEKNPKWLLAYGATRAFIPLPLPLLLLEAVIFFYKKRKPSENN